MSKADFSTGDLGESFGAGSGPELGTGSERAKVIFFGNGALADAALKVISRECEVVLHARTREDLATVKEIMGGGSGFEAGSEAGSEQKIYGILASFGVMIRADVLELFEPEGILNIHPSMLPDLRGPSPIETAMLRGDTEFSVSVMKLVLKMDAGPIYHQETLKFDKFVQKAEIYEALATAGAEWIVKKLYNLPSPVLQDEGRATFSRKLEKGMGVLLTEEKTAEELFNEVRAFSGFPKSRTTISGVDCIVLGAHLSNEPTLIRGRAELSLRCKDGNYLVIDELQPAGKRAMSAEAFANGYLK